MSDYFIPTMSSLSMASIFNRPKFEVVSLFAGGGGSSTGYRMAHGKVLAINEFISEAINTYRENWPDTIILPGDVRQLTPKIILDAIGKDAGELDLLDGSPPCSAFSTAGLKDKSWSKLKKYSDGYQSNVEDLFFEYIRILRGVRPRVFIAENVSGLAMGISRGYLNEILRELRLSGYQVNCKILNAKWLGVPQSRPRVIFVGIRDDLWRPEFDGKLHPKPNNTIINCADAFKGLVFSKSDKSETDISKYSIYKLLLSLPMGGQHRKRFNLKKAHPKRCSQCITATNGSVGAANACHWDNRAFTISELKRIMSVPDDYILTGNYSKQAERLGRMVAPLMMKAVADNLCSLGVFDGDT